MLDKSIKEIEEDRETLFKMANSYDGNRYGSIAHRLHHVCNILHDIIYVQCSVCYNYYLMTLPECPICKKKGQ